MRDAVDSAAEWYFVHSDETYGPVTFDRLIELVQRDKIRPDCLIWRDGYDEWKPFNRSDLMPRRAPLPPPQQKGSGDQDGMILDRGSVRISRSVAQFNNTTYAINSLGSIRVDPPQPRVGQKVFGIIVLIFAIMCALLVWVAISDSKQLSEGHIFAGVVVLAIAGIGIAIFASAKPTPYILVFRTASGDVQAYVSHQQHDIMEIKHAIEYALHLRA